MKLKEWLEKNKNCNKLDVKYFNKRNFEYYVYVDPQDSFLYLNCEILNEEIKKDKDFIIATCWLHFKEIELIRKK